MPASKGTQEVAKSIDPATKNSEISTRLEDVK